MTLSCLTGNVVAALIRLGCHGDTRAWQALDWLVDIQREDGGWLCPYRKAHVRDKHSCFCATICALEGLSEIPTGGRSQLVEQCLAQSTEFPLMHHLFRSEHHSWQVINPRWLELAFPWFADYAVL